MTRNIETRIAVLEAKTQSTDLKRIHYCTKNDDDQEAAEQKAIALFEKMNGVKYQPAIHDKLLLHIHFKRSRKGIES
jgi:acyl-ACP thioesterase